jgi:hypothetical protein
MAVISLSVDFSGAFTIVNPVNNFSASGFDFTSVDPMQTEQDSGIQGLAFADSGMTIALPIPRNEVKLALIGGANEMRVQGLAPDGTVVALEVVAAGHILRNVQLKAAGIASVTVDQGNNEGLLVSIAIEVEIG